MTKLSKLIWVLSLLLSLPLSAAHGQQAVLPYYTSGPSHVAVTPGSPMPVTGATNVPSYAAGNVGIANTGAGDILCIAGSATKTIYVKRIRVSGIATAAIVVDTSVIKRSTLGTGGTSATETAVPLDSNNAAATATVKSYSVSPTAGTAVGTVRARHQAIGVQGNTATTAESLFDFAEYYDQPLTLRGAAQNACINVGAAGAGGSWAADVEWTEQ